MQIQRLDALFASEQKFVGPQSQIFIKHFSEESFEFYTEKKEKSKEKKQKSNYKLRFFSGNENLIRKLLEFVQKFPIRVLRVNINRWTKNSKQCYCRFSEINFKHIQLFEKLPNGSEEEMSSFSRTRVISQIISLPLMVESLEFDMRFKVQELLVLAESIESYQQNLQLKLSKRICRTNSVQTKTEESDLKERSYCFEIDRLDEENLLGFLDVWCHRKCKSSEDLSKIQASSSQATVYKYHPSQYLLSACLSQETNQQFCTETFDRTDMIHTSIIHITFRGEEVLCVSEVKGHGYGLYVRKALSCSQKFVFRVLKLILGLKYFINCEIEAVQLCSSQGPKQSLSLISEIIQMLFCDYQHHNNYLIKLGNQIEVTSYRLSLNTRGMSDSEVTKVLRLMRQPGHYEFVCYGTDQHFEEITQLFCKKPFIRFNFFVPLLEQTLPILNLTAKMESMANSLKRKVTQFAALVLQSGPLRYSFVETVFLFMNLIADSS